MHFKILFLHVIRYVQNYYVREVFVTFSYGIKAFGEILYKTMR